MPAGKWETGRPVFRQSIACGFEGGAIVALFATVLPGSAGKLPVVFILVTIHAKRKLDLVPRILSCRNMAGSALDRFMRKGQRKAGLRVIGHAERRWAPTLHGVTALASPPIGAL